MIAAWLGRPRSRVSATATAIQVVAYAAWPLGKADSLVSTSGPAGRTRSTASLVTSTARTTSANPSTSSAASTGRWRATSTTTATTSSAVTLGNEPSSVTALATSTAKSRAQVAPGVEKLAVERGERRGAVDHREVEDEDVDPRARHGHGGDELER